MSSTKNESVIKGAIASGLFSGYFRGKREKYTKLRENLLKARMFVPVEIWLSKAVFYSIIAAFGAVACYIFLKVIILPLIPELSPGFTFTDLATSIALAWIAFFATYAGFYKYPGIKAWELRGRIDMNVPYAIGYISSMASIGVIPYDIFKRLSEREETYGDVSKELKLLVRDVELLGFDFITALKTLAATTPSENMQAFLQGASTTALSGGEMGSYFINTSREYMEERRKKYESFIETLSLFAEFYTIGMVAAPLLLVVILSIMVFLGGASLEGLAAIIYVIIPLCSAGFIFLISTLSSD